MLSVVAASSSSAQAIVPGIIEGTGLTAIRSAAHNTILRAHTNPNTTAIDTTNEPNQQREPHRVDYGESGWRARESASATTVKPGVISGAARHHDTP